MAALFVVPGGPFTRARNGLPPLIAERTPAYHATPQPAAGAERCRAATRLEAEYFEKVAGRLTDF